MVAMVASLLMLSAPVLVGLCDVAISAAIASKFACVRCYGLRGHFQRYGFRSSLVDIPLVSIARSLVILCVYCLTDGPGLSHGPYLGTVTLCSVVSVIVLGVKACIYTAIQEVEQETSSASAREKLLLKKSWGMPVLFLLSLVFALGHVVVAYRISCRARRKLLFHRVDPESVLGYKNLFAGFQKVPRSPNPNGGKSFKTDSESKRRTNHDEHGLPISLLADVDSLFMACQGLTLHYKVSPYDTPPSCSLGSSPFQESSLDSSPTSASSVRLKSERAFSVLPKVQCHLSRSLSNQFQSSSLYAPLLADSLNSPTFSSEQVPILNLDYGEINDSSPSSICMDIDNDRGKPAIVLIHGFGGGVFSWRHVMGILSRQIGCTVVAFDRPGCGLTSRPRRKEWEAKKLQNPYRLESQVELLLAFCSDMGFSSVVLIGHDDGGLLALKAAERVHSSLEHAPVEIKGVVLVNASLSREVVPAFARILLHTSLGKKHMVRPLLRTEITQVINHRAWYDPTKLTPEVLNLYKAPLFVEGWDEALHEIGRLSFGTVLSPQDAATLLKSIHDLPVLVVAGAEDALVSLKSAQTMALKLINSRLVAISGCGHLPHEECPKALLAALSPFLVRLLSSTDVL